MATEKRSRELEKSEKFECFAIGVQDFLFPRFVSLICGAIIMRAIRSSEIQQSETWRSSRSSSQRPPIFLEPPGPQIHALPVTSMSIINCDRV